MIKPVKCGCGGEANIHKDDGTFGQMPIYIVSCNTCGMRSGRRSTEVQAALAWNRAMGIAEKSSTVERTAKVKDFGHPCGTYGYCSNCNGYCVNEEPYCPHCGARLEWE